MFRAYYLLTKPGIIRGNAITAAAGFFLASHGRVNLYLLPEMLIGISLVIASGGVFNNYIDRKIDRKMTRTKNRALATGIIPVKNALIFGSILGVLGVTTLLFYTNILTTFIAATGLFFYVVMYSIWKRRSIYGTLVGSISGAVPPVVGYLAVINTFDVGAILLFAVLVAWQMPHFYSIAIYRMKDYSAASIPVLPIIKGIKSTKIQTLFYICVFIVVTSLFTVLGYTGYIYLTAISLISIFWLWIGVRGFNAKDEGSWAKKMFGFSLLNLLAFCIMLSIDTFLH